MDGNINNEINLNNQRCDYLVLVNKENKIPDNWEEKVELIEVKNVFNKNIKIEKETFEKFNGLKSVLLEEGVDIQLDSAYRSMFKQEELYRELEEEYGIDYAKKYAAVPGYSEHHTGLSLDICIKKNGVLISENHDMIVECEIFGKIHKKLADFGFILRYLEGKENITGFEYEPWHFRYVGDVNVAKEISENGLTLEEYLDSKK